MYLKNGFDHIDQTRFVCGPESLSTIIPQNHTDYNPPDNNHRSAS